MQGPTPRCLPKRYKNIHPQNDFHKNVLEPLFIIAKVGNNASIYHQEDKQTHSGIFIRWNTTQQLTGMDN